MLKRKNNLLLSCLAFILCMTFALPAQAAGITCPVCHGTMIPLPETSKSVRKDKPCIHGYIGYDDVEFIEYTKKYVCNDCCNTIASHRSEEMRRMCKANM